MSHCALVGRQAEHGDSRTTSKWWCVGWSGVPGGEVREEVVEGGAGGDGGGGEEGCSGWRGGFAVTVTVAGEAG